MTSIYLIHVTDFDLLFFCCLQLVPGLLANWKLWPAAQLVNFTLIPPEQRILFGNVVGICWTCIISNMQQEDSSSVAADAVPSSNRVKMATATAAAVQSDSTDSAVPAH